MMHNFFVFQDALDTKKWSSKNNQNGYVQDIITK